MNAPFIRLSLLGIASLGTALLFNDPPDPVISGGDVTLSLGTIRSFYDERKAPIVMIGNSLLDEAVDSPQLYSLLGIHNIKLWRGGGGSAWWYLIFKNVVLANSFKPHAVFIFFVDFDLTWARQRTTGAYGAALNAVSLPVDRLYRDILYPGLPDRFDLFLKNHWSAYQNNIYFQNYINASLKKLIAKIMRIDPDAPDQAIATLFDDSQMNPNLLTLRQLQASTPTAQLARQPFNQQVQGSFLPPIIDLAKQHGIHLIFVRMKTRDESSNQTSLELQAYIPQLKNYLASQGCPLIDFSENPAIRLEHFGLGNHLSRNKGRQMFTPLFATIVRKQLGLKDTH